MIRLECKKIKFFSSMDKDFFFERVNGISAIKKVEVKNKDIFLYVVSKTISYSNISKLASLFDRYKIKRDQLAQFMNDNNKSWLVYHIKGVCRFTRGKIRFRQAYGVTSYLNHYSVIDIRKQLEEVMAISSGQCA